MGIRNVGGQERAARAGQPAGAAPRANLLQSAAVLVMDRLQHSLRGMLDKSDDALFELAEKATNSAIQTGYFDAMREIRLKRAAIEERFLERLRAALGCSLHSGPGEPGAGLLALVEHDAMEEDVAVASMIEKIDSACREELFALDRRVGVLLGRPDLPRHENPFGPVSICEALQAAVGTLEAGVRMRLVLLKLLDRHVGAEMLAVYGELNRFLAGAGVLVEIRPEVTRTPGGAAAEEAHRPAGDPQGAALLETLQRLLDGGRARQHAPQPTRVEQLVGDLTRLQHEALAETVAPRYPDGRPETVNVLRELKGSGALSGLDRAGDMAIDSVAMLFDYLLEDAKLPEAIRAVLARLQIPVVKVALLDREFFSKKSHPTRKLLNLAAQAGAKWAQEASLTQRLADFLQALVQKVLHEFDQDVALFGELVQDLERFLASVRAEARARGPAEHEQRRDRAETFAAAEVGRRLADPAVQPWMGEFLREHWPGLLAKLHAREGEGGTNLRAALHLLDELIWSVKPKLRADDRRRLSGLIPTLLKRLRQVMEFLGLPGEVRADFLLRLARDHALALRGQDGFGPTEQPAPNGSGYEVTAEAGPPAVTTLRRGAWVEFIGPDGTVTRARLSWTNEGTDQLLFTDCNGQKFAERTRGDLLAELRSGLARVVEA